MTSFIYGLIFIHDTLQMKASERDDQNAKFQTSPRKYHLLQSLGNVFKSLFLPPLTNIRINLQ